MSPYFPILIAHDPGAVQPPKPLPMDDLQGRLLLLSEYRGVDYAAVRGFVLSICPSLALEREKRDR